MSGAPMLEAFIEKLAGASDALPGGDTELLQLYQEIIALGFEAAKEGSAAVWDRHKDALLPVVVKDALEGCADVQRCALELMSHLAAMAEYLSPFEPQQASLLWSTVARVLHDEARGKYAKLMALLAIVGQTMGSTLMETCAEMLAPALAKAMRLDSAQAREQAAAAAHGLLGNAPRAMKQCASLSEAATEEEEGELWLPCLLRLCLDDCIGVRAEALKAAKRAVRCVGRNATVAAWVLKRVNSRELFHDMDRVLYHHEASSTGPAPPRPPPLAERNTSQPSPAAASIIGKTKGKRAPSAARVKHAMMAWAVHLSLADFGGLTARESSGDVNAYERSTNKFLAVSGRFKDPRPTVREAAVEAWGMFACTCLSDVSRRQAPKVADISVRPLMMGVLRETDARVRQAVLSSLARCVASSQPHSIKHLWKLQEKLEKAGKVGLAELIRRLAGGSHGADALHFSARMLAGLLPSFHTISGGHPSLRQAGLALTVEVSPLLSTLQTLMKAIPPPCPEMAIPVGTAASPPKPGAPVSSLDALPTWSLIARAWCGLALWAVSERSACLKGIAGGSGARGDVPTSDGGEKGKGKVGDNRKGEETPSGTETGENGKTKPLSSVLDWLLSGVAPAESGSEAVPVAPTCTSSSSPAVDNAGAPSGTIGGLAEWKRVLLAGFVRALSSQSSFKPPREVLEGGHLDICQVRAWLDAPVTTSFFDARLRGASREERAAGSSCPDCAMAEDVRDTVFTGCCGAGISSEQSVLPCRRERDHEGATPRECPLWLALLLGVLGGRCGRRSHEEQGGHLPPLVQCTCIGGSSRAGDIESTGNSRHPYLPETVLAEVLDLSPGGAPAKLLSSLSRRLSTLPVERAGGKSDGEMRDELARRRSSILLALARVWRAEASRNISAWKPLSRSPAVADTAAAAAFGGFQAPLNERESSDVSPALGIGAEQRPDDGLLERTADTLRLLLKAVTHFVVRSPPDTRDLPLGDSAPERREAAGGADGTAQSAEARRLSDRRGHDVFGAIEEAFGGQAAALWRDLFEARRGHRSGFPNLLKKLAKDCATLALCSAPVESVAESAASGKGEGLASHASSDIDGKLAAWGFAFSQSQPTQRDLEEEARRRGRGAVAWQGKSPRALGQDGSNGQDLAPPPPLASLPILAAVTLSLFHVSRKEAGTTRSRAWGAGLATLAWVLTSTTSTSTETAQPPGGVGVAPSTESKRTPAVDGVITNLVTVRSAVASGDRARTESDFEFPLDEDSLTPVSRFAAVGVSRSWAVQGPSPRKGQCVASHPEAREEIRALVVGVLAVVRGLPRNVVASPGLLLALSPMLEAILDMPRSSEADAIQSALLDTWNHTFGNLPGGRLWESSFPPALLRCLARMAGRAEVKMPPGMAFQTDSAEALPAFNREEVVDEGDGVEAEATRVPQGDALGVAQLSSAGFEINVAGTLPAAGARRSFMRQAQGSPANNATPTSKKRPPSTIHKAPATGSKFVRVVGSGRGSTGRRPTKRAAITTHTSLDGSQVLEPWENGSQLPDTEPDSVFPEEELFPAQGRSGPPPPSDGSAAAAAAAPARPDGGVRSTGKRGNEDMTSDPKTSSFIARDTSVINSPPRGDCTTSDRRVRPRNRHEAALDSEDTPLELDEKGTENGSSTESQQREAAAMAAIAKESRTSTGEGNVGLDGGSDRDSETANGEEVGIAGLVEEARRLARSLEAAKRSMSTEQLEEVDSLLSHTLRGVRDTKSAGGSSAPAAAS